MLVSRASKLRTLNIFDENSDLQQVDTLIVLRSLLDIPNNGEVARSSFGAQLIMSLAKPHHARLMLCLHPLSYIFGTAARSRATLKTQTPWTPPPRLHKFSLVEPCVS